MKLPIKEIPEKEYLQYSKNYEKLYQDNDPYPSSPPRHAPEAIVIKPENSFKRKQNFHFVKL
jgi:hypothetical protein